MRTQTEDVTNTKRSYQISLENLVNFLVLRRWLETLLNLCMSLFSIKELLPAEKKRVVRNEILSPLQKAFSFVVHYMLDFLLKMTKYFSLKFQ